MANEEGVNSFSATMDKSFKSVNEDKERIVGEASSPSIDRCQQDREDQGARGADAKIDISDIQGSPELRRKASRLKTATLDRMGKMFKLKHHQAAASIDAKPELTEASKPEDTCVDEKSRRDKTNSLGRMLKLVDKNGEPRKLFPQSRTGSLSRILRRKSTGAKEDDASTGENHPGVFSRMFGQWRNRSGSGNTTAEPNLCVPTIQENKSPTSKPLSRSRINLSSASRDRFRAPSTPGTAATHEENSGKVEYPA